MEFRHPGGRKVPVFLQRRSLLVMTGESRYLWAHGYVGRSISSADQFSQNEASYYIGSVVNI